MTSVTAAGALASATLTCSLVLAAQAPPTPASAPSNPPATSASVVAVPAGERIVLELEDTLHTRHTRKGDHAHFTALDDILVGNRAAIPRGSFVRALVTESRRPGRIRGRAEIRLRFEEVILPDGTKLPLNASLVRAGFFLAGGNNQKSDKDKKEANKDEAPLKGEGNKTRDLVVMAQGGAQGALIGAQVGGKKGAAYGSAVGAGIGLLSVLFERGPELELPRGMQFEVELDRDLEVPLASTYSATQLARRRAPPAASTAVGFPPPGETVPESDSTVPIPDFPEETETAPASAPETADPQPPETAPNTPTEPTPAETASAESTEPGASTPPPTGMPMPPPPPGWKDESNYKLKVDVQLVLVDAVVRDRLDRPMENLTRDDFLLYEDGVPQKIRHFSRDEMPLAVALVVDRSGSVAPYMDELRRAAYETLIELKPGDQVALFAFSSDVSRLEDLTTDRRRIAERIARIRASGGTNIHDAIFDATTYLLNAAPDRRRAVILISDNQQTTRSYVDEDQVIRTALEAETVVYSIQTPGDNRTSRFNIPGVLFGDGSVRDIAHETGGEVLDVQRVGSLSAAMAAVVSRLKLRYTLGYHSSNKARDGAFRRIHVRLNDRFGRVGTDYHLHARRGYYAPTERVASQ